MTEPCDDCNKDDSYVYGSERIMLRFIRAKKKPSGAMSNRKDGEAYLMFPRHAALPWWEPVDKIDFPIVSPATEKESVLLASNLEDMEAPAFLGGSGITIGRGGIKGGFIEPQAPTQTEEEEPADFTKPCPSEEWTKSDLLDFIKSKGGVGKAEMRKSWLLEIALNLTE